jgi:hypothetical protein
MILIVSVIEIHQNDHLLYWQAAIPQSLPESRGICLISCSFGSFCDAKQIGMAFFCTREAPFRILRPGGEVARDTTAA